MRFHKTRLLLTLAIAIGLSIFLFFIFENPSKSDISNGREDLKEVVYASNSCSTYWRTDLFEMWNNKTHDYKNNPIFQECSKWLEFEKHFTLPVVIIPRGSASPENQLHLIPEEITVVLGKNNTVFWINQDDTPSTLVSNGPPIWSTGLLTPGESSSVTFNKTGMYEYHGEPHPWKVGKVIVLDD